MFNSLQTEKDQMERDLQEMHDALEQIEREKVAAVKKAAEQERIDMKGESDAVQNFVGKILEENDTLMRQGQDCAVLKMEAEKLQAALVESEVDRDIYKKNMELYKEFFEFVRNNNSLNHQGVVQWGITSHKTKCCESSREARIAAMGQRPNPSPQSTPRGVGEYGGKGRVRAPETTRDDRHSYIPRTGAEAALIGKAQKVIPLPPRPSAKKSPDKSPYATFPMTLLIKKMEDAEEKEKKLQEDLTKELARSKELEIRCQALCSKKDKDLADARQKIACLQVQVSRKSMASVDDLNRDFDSVRAPSRADSIASSSLVEHDDIPCVFPKDEQTPPRGVWRGDMLNGFCTPLAIKKELDLQELAMQLAVVKQECKLISDDLKMAHENNRKLEFERLSDRDEAKLALFECQKKHQEELKCVQLSFENEKSIIWNEYHNLKMENQRLDQQVLSKESQFLSQFQSIEASFTKASRELELVHQVADKLHRDIQMLSEVAERQGEEGLSLNHDHEGSGLTSASSVSKREGREIEPLGVSGNSSDNIVIAIEQISLSLASRVAQIEKMSLVVREAVARKDSQNSASNTRAKISNQSAPDGEEEEAVAQVTLKLDWNPSGHVQLQEVKEKKKSSSRRQLEEARVRESELVDSIDRQKNEIEKLYLDLKSQESVRQDLQKQVDFIQQQKAEIEKAYLDLKSHDSVRQDLNSIGVKGALDLAIALGQAEQELQERDRKIMHLEAKILEYEDESDEAHRTNGLPNVRCWVVDSKFDSLETQGSMGSRQLYDHVVARQKMLEWMKKDVSRACTTIICELSDIQTVLTSTCEALVPSINFLKFPGRLSSSFLTLPGQCLVCSNIYLKRHYDDIVVLPSASALRNNLDNADPAQMAQAFAENSTTTVRTPVHDERIKAVRNSVMRRLHTSEADGSGGTDGYLSGVSPENREDGDKFFAEKNWAKSKKYDGSSVTPPAFTPTHFNAAVVGMPGDLSPITTPLYPGVQVAEKGSKSLTLSYPSYVGSRECGSAIAPLPFSPPSPPRAPPPPPEVPPLLLSCNLPGVSSASGSSGEDKADHAEEKGSEGRRVLLTIKTASLLAEASPHAYILVTLECKNNRSVTTSKKTSVNQHAKLDARSGGFEVSWHEAFEFNIEKLDQIFTFTWFNMEHSHRPTMVGYARMPAARLMAKIHGQDSDSAPHILCGSAAAQFVLSLCNQVCPKSQKDYSVCSVCRRVFVSLHILFLCFYSVYAYTNIYLFLLVVRPPDGLLFCSCEVLCVFSQVCVIW
jgi:hypothetical protein